MSLMSKQSEILHSLISMSVIMFQEKMNTQNLFFLVISGCRRSKCKKIIFKYEK